MINTAVLSVVSYKYQINYTPINIEHLAKEINKFVNGLSPPTMSDFYSFRETSYNLSSFQCL